MIGLLPMKKHSERVADKNVRLLAGRPLFFWMADTLRDSGLLSALCINTDDTRIKELARARYPTDWLIIHDRPSELTGDDVPMNDIIRHDLSRITAPSVFLQVHSTTPFLTGKTLSAAATEYVRARAAGHDSLFCVTEHHSRFYDGQLRPINHDPDLLARTQDLSPLLEDNSNFYMFTAESFSSTGSRIGKRPAIFAMAPGSYESHDIDNEHQWAHADLIARSLTG